MQQYVIFNVLKEYCIPKDELFYRFICLRKGGMHDTCALIHLPFYGECHQHCYRGITCMYIVSVCQSHFIQMRVSIDCFHHIYTCENAFMGHDLNKAV